MKTLLIEDDPSISKVLRVGFVTEGFRIDHAKTGSEGMKLATTGTYDAIVLDLMLPDRTGEEICRHLRAMKNNTPIIILTAVSNTESKVTMLDLGADDYLTKPFEFTELFARIKAQVRKQRIPTEQVIKYEDLQLDIKKREVQREGNIIKLREKEIKILEYMLMHPEHVLTREMILNYVWGPNVERFTNVVDVHVHHLRDKIDKPYPKKLFKTINNVGYKLSKH